MHSPLWLAALLALFLAGCAPKGSSPSASPPSAQDPRAEKSAAEAAEATADDFKRGEAVGKRIPFFEMRPVGGGAELTTKSLQGKVVLLDFWASWCGPCKEAIPSLKRLHDEFGGKGLTIIGANAGELRPGPGPAEQYKKKHGIPYTLTYDNDQLVRVLGVEGYPAFVLFDQQGIIRGAQLGFDENWLNGPVRDEIKRLLGA